jgi:hypothetical protein
VTDNETDPDNPAPGLECAATDVPMHYMFEIQLMTSQIVGNSTEEKRIKFDWMVKKQHVRSYLINYYAKHEVLPTGPCYLGMTRPLNLEIGMVDLGAIRQKIRADCVNWNGMNSESLEVIGDLPDYPMDSEVETGMQEQAEGKDPNETIFDLRQELTRRGKKI